MCVAGRAAEAVDTCACTVAEAMLNCWLGGDCTLSAETVWCVVLERWHKTAKRILVLHSATVDC